MSAQTTLPQCARNLPDNDGDSFGQSEDIDKDNDGLIEICDLEGLNEMRYQLDGTGYKTTDSAIVAAITTGCPSTCTGFELMRDLDFMDDTSYRASTETNKVMWTSGEGWEPVGSATHVGSGVRVRFVFNSNGYTISNLRINRPIDAPGVGFFGRFAGRIDNIRLKDVNVSASNVTGGLVGWNIDGNIRNAYVSGTIRGSQNRVGGLVGNISGGSIINSYAEVRVIGLEARGILGAFGGLVGRVDGGGLVSNSFAIADRKLATAQLVD